MLPILQSKPHVDLIPTNYVLLTITKTCAHCSSTSRSLEAYAKTTMRRSQPQAGFSPQYVTNLRRLDEPPKYNLPLEHMARTESIPYCDICFDNLDLSALPKPPEPTKTNINHLAGTATTPTKPKKEPSKPTTLEDLERML